MSTATTNRNIILRRRQVEELTALSAATIKRLIRRGIFPKSIRLSSRAVGWLESDVDEWIASRRLESEQTGGVKR